MLIAGDIGGTKTELAIFSSEAGPHHPLAQVKYRSADYPSLESILKTFLASVKMPIDRAFFAVAGPVIGGRVKTTNLPWLMEEAALAQALALSPASVHLVNDLEAMAAAIPILRPVDVQTINTGEPIPRGALGVIAPGTGLGESFLTWHESRYFSHCSEGGHADFAPTGGRQIRLLEYMLTKFDHVSYEHVCSGVGIPFLYAYLRDVEHWAEHPEVEALLGSGADPSVAIIRCAFSLEHASPVCAAAIEMLASILASETGNLALRVLATGGMYMAGGVAVHIMPALQKDAFMQSFRRKGRFAELMERIPVHVVISEVGLTGAAALGLESGAILSRNCNA